MEKSIPYVAQILVQFLYAGLFILSKLALKDGMNNFVFVTYKQVIATGAISPFAYFLERKQRPPMTWSMLLQIFLLSCVISVTQNCLTQGIYFTSSTFTSAADNIIPVVTFVMASFARLEKIDIKSLRGQAKVAGTVVCVSGAMIMTFYKGPAIAFSSSTKTTPNMHTMPTSKSDNRNIVLGSVLVYGGVISWSAWLTFQGPVIKRYPAQLSLTALICLVSAIQCALVGIICKHNQWNMWAIRPNVQLVSVVYSGVICSALAFYIQGWCVEKKGPVFAGVFSPVATLTTAILECIVLHAGSVVGAIIIVIGLYVALWGKAKDHRNIDDILMADGDAQPVNCNSSNGSQQSKKEDISV